MFSFSFGKGQGHLGLATLEVNLEGNQGLTLFFDFTCEPFDFLPVEKKLSDAQGVMVAVSRKRIHAYVHVIKKELPASNRGIAVLYVDASESQRLHLCTEQDHASLVLFENEVVMPGLAVLAYNLFAVHSLRLPQWKSGAQVAVVVRGMIEINALGLVRFERGSLWK